MDIKIGSAPNLYIIQNIVRRVNYIVIISPNWYHYADYCHYEEGGLGVSKCSHGYTRLSNLQKVRMIKFVAGAIKKYLLIGRLLRQKETISQ